MLSVKIRNRQNHIQNLDSTLLFKAIREQLSQFNLAYNLPISAAGGGALLYLHSVCLGHGRNHLNFPVLTSLRSLMLKSRYKNIPNNYNYNNIVAVPMIVFILSFPFARFWIIHFQLRKNDSHVYTRQLGETRCLKLSSQHLW